MKRGFFIVVLLLFAGGSAQAVPKIESWRTIARPDKAAVCELRDKIGLEARRDLMTGEGARKKDPCKGVPGGGRQQGREILVAIKPVDEPIEDRIAKARFPQFCEALGEFFPDILRQVIAADLE